MILAPVHRGFPQWHRPASGLMYAAASSALVARWPLPRGHALKREETFLALRSFTRACRLIKRLLLSWTSVSEARRIMPAMKSRDAAAPLGQSGKQPWSDSSRNVLLSREVAGVLFVKEASVLSIEGAGSCKRKGDSLPQQAGQPASFSYPALALPFQFRVDVASGALAPPKPAKPACPRQAPRPGRQALWLQAISSPLGSHSHRTGLGLGKRKKIGTDVRFAHPVGPKGGGSASGQARGRGVLRT